MRALQVEYTSCRRGQSTGSGFQVRSATPGLSSDELMEISRLGNYIPPGMVDSASAAGLPLSLRYGRLSSGRYCLIRSAYSGRDYSGREGNFMAHTLVLEEGPLPEPATEYLSWHGWKTALAPEEDTLAPPEPLPAIELDIVRSSKAIARTLVAAHPMGRSLLADMLAALVLGAETGRRIVLRAPPNDGWRWISALLALVPLSTAQEISISTYQSGPTDTADVNVTVPGSGFSFNATQRDYEFFLFDLAGGAGSNLTGLDLAVREYARKTVDCYLNEPARLDRFFAFMDMFQKCPADASLVDGFSLFEFVESTGALSADDARRMLAFIGSRTKPALWSRSIAVLLDVLARCDEPSFDDLCQVVRMCTAVEKDAKDESVADVAFRAWLELLNLAMEDPRKLGAPLRQYREELANRFAPAVEYTLLLADTQMEKIRGKYRTNEAAIGLVAPYLVNAVRATSTIPVTEHPDIRDLVRAAVVSTQPLPYLGAIFGALAYVDEVVGLLVYIESMPEADGRFDTVMAGCLREIMSRRPDDRWQIRQQLFDKGLGRVLLREFEALLATGDKRMIYHGYMRDALAAAPGFFRAERLNLARLFWRSLDERLRGEQAWHWLGAPALLLDPETLAEVVDCGNRRLSLDPSDRAHAKVASHLSELVATHKIPLIPDHPALRRLLESLQSRSNIGAFLDELKKLAAPLAEPGYAFVLRFVLRNLPIATFDVRQHADLAWSLSHEKHATAFVSAYVEAAGGILKARVTDRERAAVLAALIELSNDEPPLSGAAREILDKLAAPLAAHKENEVSATLHALRGLAGRDGRRDDGELARFEANVRQGQSSLANSLRRFSRRLLGRLTPP